MKNAAVTLSKKHTQSLDFRILKQIIDPIRLFFIFVLELLFILSFYLF